MSSLVLVVVLAEVIVARWIFDVGLVLGFGGWHSDGWGGGFQCWWQIGVGFF